MFVLQLFRVYIHLKTKNMRYTIGIIGSGNIGRGLAIHLAKTSHKVIIANSRGAESLQQMVASIGGSLTAADLTEAIQQSDVLFIAVPWNAVAELATKLADYSGKIIVDTTNPVVSMNPFSFANLGDQTSGEYNADLFPKQHLVKAFNTLAAATLEHPTSKSEKPLVVFFSGDDNEAKKTVSTIVKDMGFAPVNIGSLKDGGKLQDMNGGTLAGIELAKVN
jgi:predicted dinucleotide-binding enzyme